MTMVIEGEGEHYSHITTDKVFRKCLKRSYMYRFSVLYWRNWSLSIAIQRGSDCHKLREHQIILNAVVNKLRDRGIKEIVVPEKLLSPRKPNKISVSGIFHLKHCYYSTNYSDSFSTDMLLGLTPVCLLIRCFKIEGEFRFL